MLRRLSVGEELVEYPARLRRKDGSVREVVIGASVYRDAGCFVHTRCFIRDITEQKRAEESVRSLQRLESVGQLAGGVAHEVNNQMTVVLGAADFIRRHHGPAPRLRPTDLALPRLDGLGLARAGRSASGNSGALMTGYNSSESMRRSALVRGHPPLEKPFTSDDLARRVRAALDTANL